MMPSAVLLITFEQIDGSKEGRPFLVTVAHANENMHHLLTYSAKFNPCAGAHASPCIVMRELRLVHHTLRLKQHQCG